MFVVHAFGTKQNQKNHLPLPEYIVYCATKFLLSFLGRRSEEKKTRKRPNFRAQFEKRHVCVENESFFEFHGAFSKEGTE